MKKSKNPQIQTYAVGYNSPATLHSDVFNGELLKGRSSFAEAIEDFVRDAHGCSLRRGWYKDPKTGKKIKRNDGEMIALMHSELSEALEGIRKDSQDGHLPQFKSVEVELADALIQIFDYAGFRKLHLGDAYAAKRIYNETRPDHDNKNRAKKGGKKF